MFINEYKINGILNSNNNNIIYYIHICTYAHILMYVCMYFVCLGALSPSAFFFTLYSP